MTELREALDQIGEIRLRMAQAQVFRGYRAAPTAVSGAVAIAAAIVQALWLAEPRAEWTAWLALWLAAAALSGAGVLAAVILRRRLDDLPLQRYAAWLALEQFLPCVVVGGVVTYVLWRQGPGGATLLPGLWQLLFSLGLFASCRQLPGAIAWVAVFYLCAGAVTLTLARGEHAFSPWAMGLPFGAGQLLTAGLLFWTLERNGDEAAEG